MLIKSNNRYILNPYIDDLLNSLKTGVIQLNNKNEITYISKGITTLLGHRKSSIINQSIFNIINNDDVKKLDGILNKTIINKNIIKIKCMHKNGSYIFIKLAISKKTKDKNVFLVIQNTLTINENISDLIQLAYNDQLTQIPNLTLFMDRAKITQSQSKRQKLSFAIFYIDIDGFKKINDEIGHFAGDVILKTLSGRLKKSIRESDTVARIGGDEFLILLQNITSKNDLSIIIERIFKSNKEPITINGINILIKISLGISIYPNDSDDINELIKKADKAMYKSKNMKPNNFMYYDNTYKLNSQ